MSNNLGIVNLTDVQNNKEITVNNANAVHDAAITEALTSDFASSDIELSTIQTQQNVAHILDNVTVARVLTFATAVKHLFLMIGEAGNTADVTVTVGTTTETVSANETKLMYTDGTVNGLFVISGGAAAATSQYFSIVSFDYTTNTAIGDGAGYFHIPPDLDGMNLTYVHAQTITAGVTGTLTAQVHNLTDAVDMLSTALTIDTTELGSHTAAIPAVIDVTNDDVATNDIIRLDVNAIHTGTAAIGLIFTLGFETP